MFICFSCAVPGAPTQCQNIEIHPTAYSLSRQDMFLIFVDSLSETNCFLKNRSSSIPLHFVAFGHLSACGSKRQKQIWRAKRHASQPGQLRVRIHNVCSNPGGTLPFLSFFPDRKFGHCSDIVQHQCTWHSYWPRPFHDAFKFVKGPWQRQNRQTLYSVQFTGPSLHVMLPKNSKYNFVPIASVRFSGFAWLAGCRLRKPEANQSSTAIIMLCAKEKNST